MQGWRPAGVVVATDPVSAPPHRASGEGQPPIYKAHSRSCRGVPSNGPWADQGLVFRTSLGTLIRCDNLHDKYWKPLLRRAGLPHSARFHDLRHTCATLLLTKGVHPKIVSEVLGHSSIAITLDTYSHMIPSLGDAAAGAMEDALR